MIARVFSNLPMIRSVSRTASCALLIAAAVLGAPSASAADAKKLELSEEASVALGKLNQLRKENNLEGAMAVLDAFIAKAPKDSYDYAFSQKIKVQFLYQKQEMQKLIPPLEEMLRMGYFDTDVKFSLEMIMFLTQLYFVEAGGTKDEAAQKALMKKAVDWTAKWFKLAPPPPETPTDRYSEAIATNANALFQLGKTKEALAEVQRAMRYSVKPKDNLYVLQFVCQQSLGDIEAAAETLELLVVSSPKNKAYWTQLFAFYLSDKKDEKGAMLRAVVTQNRAIENGAMNGQKDYMILFGLYYNLGEYGRAAQNLQEWLRTGKVENVEENWEHLSYCYQLLRREDMVVKVLEEGSEKFPTGNLSFALANYYWYDGKYEKAIEAGLKAWKKGGLKFPGKASMFLAQAYNEVRNLDPDFNLTRKWVEEALKFPENQKEGKRMITFLDEVQGRNKVPDAPKKPKS